MAKKKSKAKAKKSKAKPAKKKTVKRTAAKAQSSKGKPVKAKKSKATKKPVKAAAKKPATKIAKKPAPKPAKVTKQTVGEGSYEGTRAFDKAQAGFVKANKDKIPAMGKAAEAALEGPEGDSLREAEAAAAARSRDTF